MRCSKCGTENLGKFFLGAEWGLRFVKPLSSAIFAALAIVLAISSATPDARAGEDPPLLRLAAVAFPNLTHAERAMLEFAQAGNVDRGEFAQAGLSANPKDPSNDPKGADEWSKDREIRAQLIRWVCEDPRAVQQVAPTGIRVMGARIRGPLNLSSLHLPFAIVARRSVMSEGVHMARTEIPYVDLDGSYISELDAKGVVIHGDLDMANVHSSGEVLIEGARIDGDLNLRGTNLHHSKVEMLPWSAPLKAALDAAGVVIGGAANICCGFESDGAVLLQSASIKQGLLMWGAHLSNPDNVALSAAMADIPGGVGLGGFLPTLGGFQADGRVEFGTAKVKVYFQAVHAKFAGAVSENPALLDLQTGHGLFAGGMTVDGPLFFTDVKFENGAVLNLAGAKVSGLVDEEKSWPEPGRLLIDGFTYDGLGEPRDARSRLRWLALQPGFHQQPYRQLAKVLEESGDDSGAIRVLIAKEDLRYASYGTLGRLWGNFLEFTIGYGHRPMLTIMWSALVVLLGWSLVGIGNRAGVMRRTYPENAPGSAVDRYEDLYPLLYSLDVFLPFVNLHQEHYWWPDGRATGEFTVLGGRVPIRGSMIRCYLWLQIIAGWLLSAIFVAGVTGLIRGD